MYILAAAQIAAQGCRVFMFSGSQHIDGTLEHEEARKIGKAYREIEKFESYLSDREIVSEIGIIQSDLSIRIKATKSLDASAITRVRAGSDHRNALLGAMKLCDHSKYPWKVIPEQEVNEAVLKRHKIIILPSLYHVSDELKATLTSYVKQSGVIIASDETSLYDQDGQTLADFNLSALFGCSFIQTNEQYKTNLWGSYLQIHQDAIWQYTGDTMPPITNIRYQVKSHAGNILANFINPATELTDTTWVNWWSPPPSEVTHEPAIVENQVGEGKVLYTAFNLFDMENHDFNWLKDFFQGFVEKYIPAPSIRLMTNTPQVCGLVSYEREGEQDIIIHEVSHIAELTKGDAPEVDGGTMRLNPDYKAWTSAELIYLHRIPLDLVEKDGMIEVALPKLQIHQMIQLKYK